MGDEADGSDEVVKGGINKKLMLIVLLLVLVAGGGGAFFFMTMGSNDHEKKKGDHQEAGAHAEEEAEPDSEQVGPVLDLEPFVLNLADRDQLRYLKVSIKLQLDRPEEQTDYKDKLPAIRDALLVLLTSKESRGLRTVDGKMLVRDEIGGRINAIMKKGKIRQVFFTEFIIQ